MRDKRRAGVVVVGVLSIAVIAGACASLRARGEEAVQALARARCAPLKIVDRFGRALREVPGECGPYGRVRWTRLNEVPPVVVQVVVESEDRRYEQHPGIDPLAAARAAWTNLRENRIVSGASTLTMQLARMLDAQHAASDARQPAKGVAFAKRADIPSTSEEPRETTGEVVEARGAYLHSPPRSWLAKLSHAWTALAIEQRLTKQQILEAYLNLAYYGAGAHGIEAAARAYFGKSLRSLDDAESSVLAVLPRAPSAYDLRRDPARATQRRDNILARLVGAGELAPERARSIAAARLLIQARTAPVLARAGHFVDYVLAQLPDAVRRSGGELRTTLDLDLQSMIERIVAEHVASLADREVDQAGVVVLDADSGAIRALVGSRDYGGSQINIITRRRQLGSLLKPFVYALAIERGASAQSIALDVGDSSPDYRARDWVGREAGPLPYKEALAGSYNLAAIHVLEQVGVPALHARLRQAGVAELESPPAHYGLMLALGSARVRLLDVASGYGFLVRGGLVRPAHAIESLERSDGMTWIPSLPAERVLFSPEVSWQATDMLSDAAARHRRFGRGLPLELTTAIAAKTGTASGLSDASAVLATREFIVAGWAGRFDGKPTQGTSGMWAAAPLATRALIAALGGKQPSLPARPSNMKQTIASGARSDTLFFSQTSSALPPELEPWAERARARANGARERMAR
jgi:penicillin-binding protein 1C